MYKVIFFHHRNIGKNKLRHFIEDSLSDETLNMYGRSCTPFKDILRTQHVTECRYLAEDGTPVAYGYAFCRDDVFLKAKGRWHAENRARKTLGLDLIPDPLKDRQEAREGAAAMRHAANRKMGLERQEMAKKARESTEAAD